MRFTHRMATKMVHVCHDSIIVISETEQYHFSLQSRKDKVQSVTY